MFAFCRYSGDFLDNLKIAAQCQPEQPPQPAQPAQPCDDSHCGSGTKVVNIAINGGFNFDDEDSDEVITY